MSGPYQAAEEQKEHAGKIEHVAWPAAPCAGLEAVVLALAAHHQKGSRF
jgi:hypothetical protein